MANIVSLVVRIGAKDQEITDALVKLGSNAKKTDAELRKLGDTPLGKQAQESFAELDRTMKQVTESQQRMADRARDTARGVESLGGVARLTDRELQQVHRTVLSGLDAYRALGQQAPAELQKVADAIGQRLTPAAEGVKGKFAQIKDSLGPIGPAIIGAFSVGAITAFGREILGVADNLVKLSDKTGISLGGLQDLEAAAVASGNSLDQVTTAISQMQNRLASMDTSAVGAVRELGLSIEQLTQLDPDEQFKAIASAIASIESPAERTRLAIDLFGRAGAEILPTLRSNIEEIGDQTGRMSDDTIRALEKAGDAFDLLVLKAKRAAAGLAQIVFPNLTLGDSFDPDKQVETFVRMGSLRARIGVNKPGALPVGDPLKALGLPSGAEIKALDRDVEALESRLKKIATTAETTARNAVEANKRWLASIRPLTEDSLMIGRLAPDTSALNRTKEFQEVAGLLASHDLPLVFDKLQDIGKSAGSNFSVATKSAQSFGDFLKKDLGDVILRAFTGGGDVLKSLGAAVGGFFTSASSTIGQSLSKGLSKALGSGIGGALGSVLPGLGTAVGGLLGGLFGKLFDNPEKQINPIRQGFVDMAGGLDALNRKAAAAGVTLTEMLNAKNPQAYEAAIKKLNDAFTFQTQAMATLDETVKRYGFSIQELGPAFQKQELDKQAQQLFKDYEVLIAAGIDNTVVTEKMSAAVQDYVTKALTLGTEVPSAMKPLLQSMIDLGKLTDADGKTITSLEESGLSFALTMSEGFKSLIDEVKKLTEAIARGLGRELANLPRHIPVDIEIRRRGDDTTEIFGAHGGQVTTQGVQRFAAGGRVLPFLRRRGSDTVPAMLTPGEIVLNRGQQRAVGRALGGVTVVNNISISAQGDFSTIASEQRLARRVGAAVVADVTRAIRRGA